MLRLRSPRRDDGTICRLIEQELVPYTHTAVTAEDLKPRVISRRLDKNTTYVLAKGGRPPYGFISFMVRDGRLLVDMIALDRNYQRRGWGALLLGAAEQYGRSRKCSEAHLYVDESNTGAQRFYERHGYRVVQYDPALRCFRLAKYL